MPQPMRPPVASCTIKARSKVAVRDSPMLMVKEPSEVPSEELYVTFSHGSSLNSSESPCTLR